MRFLILGATGPSGILLIREALEKYRGATIVVYARSPEKLPEDIASNKGVIVIAGQLTDSDALEKALEGVDVVLSALGPGPWHPSGTPIAKAYEVLIELMKKQNITRLICLGTGSIPDPNDKSSLLFKALVTGIAMFAHTAYVDIVAVGEVIRTKGEGLEWTIVRVPVLTNDDSKAVAAGYIGDPKVGASLSRKGFAAFVIEEVEKKEWVNKAPLLSSV